MHRRKSTKHGTEAIESKRDYNGGPRNNNRHSCLQFFSNKTLNIRHQRSKGRQKISNRGIRD